MGYLLVKQEVLESKGIQYFERIPDGRGIVDFSMLRVIGSVDSVQIIGSKKNLTNLYRNRGSPACMTRRPYCPNLTAGR